jgi:HlyD family secretion protein
MIKWRTISILILGLLLLGTSACGLIGDGEEAPQEQVKVTRGDLTITVNGIGNMVIDEEQILSFGSAGKVEEVNVDEGDRVSEGDILAKLDTDTLELALTEADLALAKQQLSVSQAEVSLAEQRLAVNEAEVALAEQQVTKTEAEVAIETAEYNLFKAQDKYIWLDIDVAQADVDEAQRYLDDALWALNQSSEFGLEWQQKAVIHAQSRLDTAKDILDAMLAGTDPKEVAVKKLELELAETSLELSHQSEKIARQSLLQAKLSEELAEKSLEQEQQSLIQVQQSLTLAQKQLDDATLTSPFDGVIASVFVDEGDTVAASTAVIHLVDPDSLKLEAEVDEIDILRVKVGQKANVYVDALPDHQLNGEVTFIPPISREEPGLVLFDVKISFQAPPGLELRGGMSATADILVDERADVLLVPNEAITLNDEGSTIVTTMADGLAQEKPVITGISNDSHTEIINGLGEGDTVVIRTEE